MEIVSVTQDTTCSINNVDHAISQFQVVHCVKMTLYVWTAMKLVFGN